MARYFTRSFWGSIWMLLGFILVTTALTLTALYYAAHAIVDAEKAVREAARDARNAYAIALVESIGYEVTPTTTLDEFIEEQASIRKVHPDLGRAIIHVESRGNPKAKSSAGAIGLMQVMPFNAARCKMTPKDLENPRKNVQCGFQILSEDLETTAHNVPETLMLYNGGTNCRKGACETPREYQRNVLTVWSSRGTKEWDMKNKRLKNIRIDIATNQTNDKRA